MKIVSLFNLNDITRSFDERDLRNGRTYQYQSRVHDLKIENAGTRILSKVQGSAGRPYEVIISIEKRNGRPTIHSECTCAVTYMCKHGAATLFETIAQWDRQRERLPIHKSFDKKESTPPSLNALVTAEQSELNILGSEPAQRLIYIIGYASFGKKPKLMVTPALEYTLKNGMWSKPRPHSFQQILSQNQNTRLLTEEDHEVFRLAHPHSSFGFAENASWHAPEDPVLINNFLHCVMATGRGYYLESGDNPLKQGPTIEANLTWVLLPDGKQKPILEPVQSGLQFLMSNCPWYINPVTHESGPLKSNLSFDQVQTFLEISAVSSSQIEKIRAYLSKSIPHAPLPYLISHNKSEKALDPIPKIHVQRSPDNLGSVAQLKFLYGKTDVNPSDPSPYYAVLKKDQAILHRRNKKVETAFVKQLTNFQLEASTATAEAPLTIEFGKKPQEKGLYFKPVAGTNPWFWLDFMHESAPLLRKEGYKIECDENCGMDVLEPDEDAIEASFTQSGEWWFSLDLGITVNGKRMALLPILVSFLRGIQTLADIERLTAGKKCYAPLPDGRYVALPSARVKTILGTLVELFDNKPLDDKGQLRVSFDLASALVKIKDFTHKRWLGEGKLKELVDKLSNFDGIVEVPLPTGLNAELRTYQKQGYDWLHFLGSYNLGGVLADDMGLGKTIQALAYVLSLKQKNKLGTCLVSMPTSLVTNWQAEAARFTPALKVLTLHGKDRAEKFHEIKDADIVLSTYPLVMRDIDALCEHKWGLVILDEAQAIKNPSSKIMQAVCQLDSKQRLCLTGTPLENHLGEIWSIFTFLMPGLLGDYKSFSHLYRTPIEKLGDTERQIALSRRLRPFILRRLKSEVTKELPSKTEIIQRVTLGDDQRDLYETVRHVMNEKVQEEVTSKGLARSQIVILDALLKLRQVCCDPRLVKIAAASKTHTSAKLTTLLGMLPTLIEDGRRILLFSQFTSMLDLIKPELDIAGIPYVELRGTTKDRRTPVARFQKKEVPLFLISLKAGGTGLNLTAADTVIHFDPWWNPSVERQATDRAYRIGQDKPVFVYKLIAEGTVEERIVDLQNKKSHLASALFGDTPSAAAKLTSDDLKWLLDSGT